MVQGILAGRADDFEHPEPPWVSIAEGCEDESPKKTMHTDAIFENVWAVNALGDDDGETLRISVDTKATIHVGAYSRGGRSRGLKPVQAWDHEMRPKEKLVPGGILEPVSGRAFLFCTGSHKTSDFLVDGLVVWWVARKQALSGLKRLFIEKGVSVRGKEKGELERRLKRSHALPWWDITIHPKTVQ